MDTNYGQAGAFIFVMPTPQLRDNIAAVNSAIGPKVHQHDAPFELANGERLAVDPVLPGDIRGGGTVGDRSAGSGPDRPDRKGKH